MFDAVVVGGGAAGMMAAITAAERGKHVLLLEKNAQLGRKIRITGKGRCNVTNNCEPRTVIESTPGNGRFLYGAVNHFTPQDTMDFFEGLGVPLKTERGNRVFPVSDNAHDIADALWKKLKKCRVEIRQGNVKEVLTENGSVIGVRTKTMCLRPPACFWRAAALRTPARARTATARGWRKSWGTPLFLCVRLWWR